MPIYVYETVGRSKRQFEVQQSMKDEPLKVHPETGEAVQRVITGGYGFIDKGKSKAKAQAAPRRPGCCGGGGCGCHH